MNESEIEELREVWEEIFRSTNPFSNPFVRDWSILVFHPTDAYHVTRDQFAILRNMHHRVAGGEVVVTEVEWEGSFFARGKTWILDGDEPYREYFGLPIGVENTIYARNGKWGAILSHELHAILGGTPEVITALRDEYDGWDVNWQRLKEYWSESSSTDWLHSIEDSLAMGR